jgi:diguanylate cyclase (GGDEF)-like protein/PAS domain S-box-containing protein
MVKATPLSPIQAMSRLESGHIAAMLASQAISGLPPELVASEEMFRRLAEQLPGVVVRIGSDGGVCWVSPALTTVVGWFPEEWIGRELASFTATEADRERLRHGQRDARAGQRVVLRVQVRTKVGPVRWVELHAGPSRDAGGEIDGAVASFRCVDAEVAATRALEERAQTDALTGLFNRQEALRALAGRAGRQLAILWCDIDNFKTVNDTSGHAVGDMVLVKVADRIRACLRSSDDLGARIGGDELMVVLDGVWDLETARQVGEKLRQLAAEPTQTPAGEIGITLSIGVTLAGRGENTDAIIARADDAMYRAKRQGGNQVMATVIMPLDIVVRRNDETIEP